MTFWAKLEAGLGWQSIQSDVSQCWRDIKQVLTPSEWIHKFQITSTWSASRGNASMESIYGRFWAHAPVETSCDCTWSSLVLKCFEICLTHVGRWPLVWKTSETWKCLGIWQLSGKCQGFYWKSGNCQGKNFVRVKLPKTVYCKLHICVHTGM